MFSGVYVDLSSRKKRRPDANDETYTSVRNGLPSRKQLGLANIESPIHFVLSQGQEGGNDDWEKDVDELRGEDGWRLCASSMMRLKGRIVLMQNCIRKKGSMKVWLSYVYILRNTELVNLSYRYSPILRIPSFHLAYSVPFCFFFKKPPKMATSRQPECSVFTTQSKDMY